MESRAGNGKAGASEVGGMAGKSVHQSEDVMWSEQSREAVSHVPRKAAIVIYVPVP